MEFYSTYATAFAQVPRRLRARDFSWTSGILEQRPPAIHVPVLLEQVLDVLEPGPGQVIVDGTLGHGGHSLALLQRMGETGRLIGIERDPWMLATARERLEREGFAGQIKLIQGDHADLARLVPEALKELGREAADAILLDLGPSTPQLLDPGRGYSWTSDQALDMRRDPEGEEPSAAEIVNEWPAEALARLFKDLADERWAKRIALRIVEAREQQPITTGRQLGEIVGAAIPRKAWPPKIHPATRVFLALRIEVNREYATLEEVLPTAFDLLGPSGRLAVISFHSGEDRRVKDFMRAISTPPEAPWPLPKDLGPARAINLTRKSLTAGEEELGRNPHSRSARLRAVMKNPAYVEPAGDTEP